MRSAHVGFSVLLCNRTESRREVGVGLALEMRCTLCSSVQMLRDDMPTLFQGVRSMRCFVWQDNMVLMFRIVRDAIRMVRAGSSDDELDV